MKTEKKSARIAGILYIIGTVTGVLSVVFAGSILDNPEDLVNIAVNAAQVRAGVLFIMLMGLALAMVPVVVFQVLRNHNETLALGYVVFRGALETVTYLAMVISKLVLLSLSLQYVQTGASNDSFFKPLSSLVQANEALSFCLTVVFILGAVMFYTVLYQSRLIPRWISGWGLISAVPYLLAGVLLLFGLTSHMDTVDTVLRLPLGLQEMVMAVWLVVKGFNPSEHGIPSARADNSLI